MPWAIHSQGCCCEEGACHFYIPCCINDITISWHIENLDNPPTEQGILFSAHLENLCQGSEGIGSDWSRFRVVGDSWSKMPAAVLKDDRSTINSEKGCLMNMAIQPIDLVCQCEGQQDNFKLVLELYNCDPGPVTWKWEVGSTTLCFGIGNGYLAEPRVCCMAMSGYSIGGGTIIRDPNSWMPGVEPEFEVGFEEFITLEVYFRPDSSCATCIDPSEFPGEDNVAVFDDYTECVDEDDPCVQGTPQKVCYIKVCDGTNATFPLPTVEETHLDCDDCNPAPSYKPRFDSRTQVCDNCYWALVAAQGWTQAAVASYGYDEFCNCGCPNCATRLTEVDCVPPSTLGPGRSDSGSRSICLSYGMLGGTVWHAVEQDGCVFTPERFLIGTEGAGLYSGPCGAVTMEEVGAISGLGGMTAADKIEFEDWWATLDFCHIVPITWHTDSSGAVRTISMSIGGYNSSRTVAVPPFTCGVSQPIHWKTDIDCSGGNQIQRQLPPIIPPANPGQGMSRWIPPREF